MNVKLNLSYDRDAECPSEFGGWKLISFNRRHHEFQDPDELIHPHIDEDGNQTGAVAANEVGLAKKLEAGTAFILSYHEHGQCVWGLEGEVPPCRWDSVRVAGLLVWQDDPKWFRVPGDAKATYQKRQESARAFLKEYTSWANGDCYIISLKNAETGEDLDDGVCCAVIGQKSLEIVLAEDLGDHTVVEVDGDASEIAQYIKFPEGVYAVAS